MNTQDRSRQMITLLIFAFAMSMMFMVLSRKQKDNKTEVIQNSKTTGVLQPPPIQAALAPENNQLEGWDDRMEELLNPDIQPVKLSESEWEKDVTWANFKKAVEAEKENEGEQAIELYTNILKEYESKHKKKDKNGLNAQIHADFAATAVWRLASLQLERAISGIDSESDIKKTRKKALKTLESATHTFPYKANAKVWIDQEEANSIQNERLMRGADKVPFPRSSESFNALHAHKFFLERLDTIFYHETFRYRLFDGLVGVLGGQHWLAIIVLTVLVRILLFPLSRKQQKSALAMQQLQPEMKELQDRYKKLSEKAKNPDEKTRIQRKQQREMGTLWKSAGVNPLGCVVPMLVMMPVLIFVYRAVLSYKYELTNAHFLWIQDPKNLAMPDLWLFGVYLVSMYLQQKFMTMSTPTTDPQQQSQQKMMQWMMLIMFGVFFKGFPAAFILYWLCFNVCYTLEQIIVKRGMANKMDPDKKQIKGLALSPRHAGGQAPKEARDLSGKKNPGLKTKRRKNQSDKL